MCRRKIQNLGIGTELINLTAKKAKKEGFKPLSLIVFADNARALHLYRKIGFAMVKHIDLQPHKYIQHEGGCLLMKYDIVS